jgi:hypothetical protein
MLKLLRLFVMLAGAAALALLVAPVANAAERTTFVVPLSAECPEAVAIGATGNAVIHIDAETGEIKYRVVAENLPGTIADSPGVHIHGPIDPVNGPIAVHLDLTDRSDDLVAKGTAAPAVTSPTLASLILANPENFYVNVHTTTCRGGAIRGSLG